MRCARSRLRRARWTGGRARRAGLRAPRRCGSANGRRPAVRGRVSPAEITAKVSACASCRSEVRPPGPSPPPATHPHLPDLLLPLLDPPLRLVLAPHELPPLPHHPLNLLRLLGNHALGVLPTRSRRAQLAFERSGVDVGRDEGAAERVEGGFCRGRPIPTRALAWPWSAREHK